MLTDQRLVAFVATSDLDRAAAFYGDVLGLRLLEQTPYACVLDAHGTTLRVTLVGEVATPGYTMLGWQVDDLPARVTSLTARGVTFLTYDGLEQDELGIWTTPTGEGVAWFGDPDGNTLSLTQASARDAAAGEARPCGAEPCQPHFQQGCQE